MNCSLYVVFYWPCLFRSRMINIFQYYVNIFGRGHRMKGYEVLRSSLIPCITIFCSIFLSRISSRARKQEVSQALATGPYPSLDP